MKWEEEISPEEARKILEEMGIPMDAWQRSSSDEDVEIKTLPTFARMAVALKTISSQIEDSIAKDRAQIQELHEKEKRLKHGGGR